MPQVINLQTQPSTAYQIASGLQGGIETLLAAYLKKKELDRQAEQDRRQAELFQMQKDAADLQTQSELRKLAEPDVLPGQRPVVPAIPPSEFVTPQEPVSPDGLPVTPAGTPPVIPLGPGLQAQEEPVRTVTLPGVTFKGKEVVPPTPRPQLYQSDVERARMEAKKAEARAEAEAKMEIIPNPDFDPTKPATASNSMMLPKSTVEKKMEQKRKDEEAASAAPTTKNIGGREMGWNPVTKKFDRDMGPAGKPSEAAGKWVWDNESGTSVYKTNDEIKSAPPGRYADVTTGRKASEAGEAGKTMQTLIENADTQLKRYEELNKGARRFVPAQVDAEKYVAWNAYLNALQSLGQIFGRTVLADQRVSDQDRAVYSQAIGSTSQIVNVLDPSEARRRLELLKKLNEDYRGKYPAQGKAEAAPTAGTTPAAPGMDSFLKKHGAK